MGICRLHGIRLQASLEMAVIQIRKPRAEIRKKSEIRSPKSEPGGAAKLFPTFGFHASSRLAGLRTSDFEIRTSPAPSLGSGLKAGCSISLVYYAFWVALSLVVAALIACIFYVGFLLLNRML